MEWVEIKARSVEQAKEEALDRLGVAADEAEFEVVQEAESKLFGLRKTEARVRARVRPRPPRPKAERRQRKGQGGGNRNRNRNRGRGKGGQGRGGQGGGGNQGGGGQKKSGAGSGGGKSGGSSGRNRGGRDGGGRAGGGRDGGAKDKAAAVTGAASAAAGGADNSTDNQKKSNNKNSGGNPSNKARDKEKTVTEEVPIAEQQECVQHFLEGVLDGFGIEGSVSSELDADEVLQAKVDGSDLGLLVGPKGNTLTALQDLARAAMQRTADGRHTNRLTLDVGGYRERRKAALRSFTEKQAQTVLDSGKRVALEPMGSADRKTVHDAASEIDGVDTISEGDEPRRRVVIVPAD